MLFDFTNTPVTAALTLYAQWSIAHYTVDFDTNGNSDVIALQTVEHGGSASEPEYPPAREGYQFLGWSLSQEEGGSLYIFTGKITASRTLYAQWKQLSYKVDFDFNGGIGYLPAQTVKHGDNAANPGISFQREGHQFRGWAQSDTGGSGLFSFADTPITGTLTLYAQWTRLSYMVNFDFNGGSGSADTQTESYEENISEPSTIPVRDGYQFRGWSIYQGDGGILFDFDNTAITRNHTLYAQWTQLSYTVNFDPNGGHTYITPQTVYHGAKAMNPGVTPQRSGYQFRGWSLSSAEGGILFSFTTTSITTGTTLYAQWAKIIYTVQFDVNGGTGTIDSQRIGSGDKAS